MIRFTINALSPKETIHSVDNMGFKSLIVVSALLVAVFGKSIETPKVKSDVHNIDLCTGNANKLVYQTQVIDEGKLFQTLSEVRKYPSEGVINNAKITCIYVDDLIGNGEGGYPTITDGGIGATHVTIKMVSQWSKGMAFIISIYTE
ncbi:probable salivary secreted peptide [Aethina tumida]|uniref:probable salivary secreted peptide n=1 Tax=Aethina tumida TaxID=116153 RepID=UPI00096B6772|nr:probable salivary secreted peptide [Aethina tumida]